MVTHVVGADPGTGGVRAAPCEERGKRLVSAARPVGPEGSLAARRRWLSTPPAGLSPKLTDVTITHVKLAVSGDVAVAETGKRRPFTRGNAKSFRKLRALTARTKSS